MTTSHQRWRSMPWLLPSTWLVACVATTSLVPHGPHPAVGGVAPMAVEGRPPPVKVQVIPPAPSDDCQWADGEWVWRASEWRWEEGRWLSPSQNCYFADAVFVWLPARTAPSGVLYYTHSQWYDLRTNERCEPPPPCLASSTTGTD